MTPPPTAFPLRRRHCLLPLLVVATLAGCGPLVVIPGGALSGTERPAPSDWSFSDDVDTVQLETNPADPYSVNVWGVAAGDAFYVAAGDGESTWAGNIEADPRVRLKIGDGIYAMTATRTTDEAELESFLVAAKAKYAFEPDEEQRANAKLFRLTPR